jgi:hypothetical protein
METKLEEIRLILLAILFQVTNTEYKDTSDARLHLKAVGATDKECVQVSGYSTL